MDDINQEEHQEAMWRQAFEFIQVIAMLLSDDEALGRTKAVSNRLPKRDHKIQIAVWAEDIFEVLKKFVLLDNMPDESLDVVMLLTDRQPKEDYMVFVERVAAHAMARQIMIAQLTHDLSNHPALKDPQKANAFKQEIYKALNYLKDYR